MLNRHIKNKIREYSLKNIPHESCGLIIEGNNGIFCYPCQNISFRKHEECILDPIDYIKASSLGKILAHFHSQPSAGPSLKDNLTCLEHNIFCIIYCWLNNQFFIIKPELEDFLLHEFEIGKNDCFSLVRKYYKNKLNIEINDYFRDVNWFNNNPNIILDNFKKEGFQLIDDNYKKNDILLFKNKDGYLTHMGICIGKDLILHQTNGALTKIENINIDKLFKKKLILIIRHVSVNELK